MDSGAIIIIATFAAMVVIAIVLMRQGEKTGSIKELEEVAAQLHSAFDEHKIALEILQAESDSRKDLISNLPKQAAKYFSSLVSTLVAIEQIDDHNAFKNAVAAMKKDGVPIENEDDEKSVRTALLILNAIIKTINEENGPLKFRARLKELRDKNAIEFSAGDRPNIILAMTKEIQNDVGFADFNQYLEILEEELSI